MKTGKLVSTYIGIPGEVRAFAGATLPAGWLDCDGSAISRTTYATLYAALGATWGSGDGSTTFNLPDLRGRAPIGAGQGSSLTDRTLAATGGAETHVLTTAQMPSHTHSIAASGNFAGATSGLYFRNDLVASGTVTGSNGSGGSHNNMQPFAVVKWMIYGG